MRRQPQAEDARELAKHEPVDHQHEHGDHEEPEEIEYYLCGPPMMINAVQNMLDSLGVPEEMIAFDSFG